LKLTLCPTSAVAEGCSLKVEQSGLVLCVFNLGGVFFVTDDTGTYGPGWLSEGCIIDGVGECDCHGGAFDGRPGAMEAPPCMEPLRTYRVEVLDGQVCIEAP